MIVKFILSLPVLLIMGFSWADEAKTIAAFQKELSNLQKQFVPDPRLDVLTAQLTRTGQEWELQGETTVPAARDAVFKLAASLVGTDHLSSSIRVLPYPSSDADKIAGLVRVSVAPMRREPRHASEMVDQVVMGTAVSVLKREKNWSFIQTPYRYLGWVESSMLAPQQSPTWAQSALARFSEPVGTVWLTPDQEQTVSDIVLGCTVKATENNGEWTAVELPDGRRGFVKSSALESVTASRPKTVPERVVTLALRLKGIPYLWGGNSTKGFDCSGFTQTVFRAAGFELPRDADQQSAVGKKVEPGPDFQNVRPGDLVFFGKDRATHVGISLGGARFIHASVDVHVNSLKRGDPDYDNGRFQTLLHIMRVFD